MSKPATVPSMFLAALVAACSTAPASDGGTRGRMIADGSSFAVRPGDMVTLSDRSTLRYISVTSDSRCPPDKQCIQAGNAVAGFEWRPANGGMQPSFELNAPDQPKSRDFGHLHVTLESLAFGTAPEAQLKVERGH